jgi:hypothetical protein
VASFNLTATRKFPEGTSVGAYPASQWRDQEATPSGAPPGAATASATVTNGVAIFTGLTTGVRYWAGASVSGTWQYTEFTAGSDFQTTPALSGFQNVNVNSVSVPGDASLVPVAVAQCPRLVPGQTKIMFSVSAELTPNAGCTSIVPSINKCNSDGTIPGGGGNIAFWHIDQPLVENRFCWGVSWVYDPRRIGGTHPADIDLGDGSGLYLGFHVSAGGGNCHAFSSSFRGLAFIFPATTIDETSANLLADSAGI